MPTNDPRPTKSQRREDARIQAKLMREQAEKRARRNRIIAVSVIVVAVLGVVAAVFFTMKGQADREAANSSVAYGGGADDVVPPALADVTAPSTANDSGGIPVSNDGTGVAGDGDVVVTIYFDPMCPYCGQFDQANSADLDALVQEDGVTIDYRPLSFLDGNSKGTHYSTRAGNALAVVADQDGEHFTAFLTALYANQPAEGSEGLTDDEIADLAVGVGVPQDVADQFLSVVDGTFTTSGSDEEKTGTWRTFAPWIMAATSQADTDLGGISTPTVLIDGQDWPADGEDKSQLYVAGPLKEAVEAALAAQG
ncbi:DsbA family protein [Cellulomonas composti]|uniref:Protein disulfide-isomerase n=1 Tax=Cellulomonas composti TaxID=266130 RepID=A0A511JD05_9CELL|nr:thioredoxin domain-containing protein [Cellulomonas composti]GEL95880.1 protein disulfide-isomerase [Cellulomonas composti]